MQNTDAVVWTKKLVGIESTNPGKEEHEIAGFLEQEIKAALPECGELKKDYTKKSQKNSIIKTYIINNIKL